LYVLYLLLEVIYKSNLASLSICIPVVVCF